MENKQLSHKELQKNIPDLNNKSENDYLYYEGYVYYSICLPGGGGDQTGWMNGGEVFKRTKDDGTKVTTFGKTINDSVSTASSSHIYKYYKPKLIDGYVHFTIKYDYSCDWESDSSEYYEYKVKADGISELDSVFKFTYANGSIYEGEFKFSNDKSYPHGKGKKTYSDGRVEEGNWDGGVFEG
jgi:hypothetical protein